MKSRFSSFHPLVNFSYYLGTIGIIMLFIHPLFLLESLFILMMIHYVSDRFKSLWHWKYFIITTGVIIFILNPIFNERGRHVLFEVFGHRVTSEAMVYGGMTALSIISVMVLFVSYNEVVTPNKLLFLFSKVLPQFAILLMLTLRFIPLMRRRIEEIATIQESKGISISKGTLKRRIINGMLYIQVLLTFSLEEAIQTADSMNARYYGKNRRTTYEFFRLRSTDIISLIYFIGLFIFDMYGKYMGYGTLTVYPNMETMQLSFMEMVILVVNTAFISFPLLVEIGDVIRWRLLN